MPVEGGSGVGGWKWRGRVERLVLCLELLVGVCRIAIRRGLRTVESAFYRR